MLKNLKKLISLDNPFRLAYHKLRAIIANIINGFPSQDMTIIGVTGTNGKTTTCNIIAKGLIESGEKIFMFTTVNIIIGDKEYVNDTKMTSPDVFYLQNLLKEAKKQGIKIAIIETASHGIKMHRVWGINYDISVLTNISQDHLDLHKTMEDYVNTKLKIFKNLISYKRKTGVKKSAIINIDSEYSSLFTAETYDVMYTYGKNPKSSILIKETKNQKDLSDITLQIGGKELHIKTKLKGEFNYYNISAAVGVLISLGIKKEKIVEAIKNVDGVPGRLEEVDNEEGIKIFIDYAHTADALENILTTLSDLKEKGKIITVFGATGDRDKSKRPIMGEIVSKYSDKIILTQDDDYSEKTTDIIKDVLPGINRKEGEGFWIIPDREDAIRSGILSSEAGDILLIAGKGDERSMITNSGPINWHDKNKVREILKAIDDNKIIS